MPAPTACRDVLILTHGAGSNRNAPLLLAVAAAFERAGFAVQRIDLAFRQARPSGPPRPGDAEKDRQGLREAVEAARSAGQVVLGGASYGGRQASILAAEQQDLVDGLLLLSYPLHPPGKPASLRTGHFPNLRVPALFVHGTRDPFGSIQELDSARGLIPARTSLLPIEGAGHDLRRGRVWDPSPLPRFFM